MLLEHSAILSTFINLPFVIKIFVLSIFEWPLKTGFTVSFLSFQGKIDLKLHLNRLQAILSLYLVPQTGNKFLFYFLCFFWGGNKIYNQRKVLT